MSLADTAVLVDTGPLYALAMERDEHHKRAQRELVALERQGYDTVVTTSTLLETQSLLLRRETPEFTRTYLNALITGSRLINPLTDDYLEAQAFLGRFEDQTITLFDATLSVLSQSLNVPIWTFDADFDVMKADVWRV